MNFLFQKQWSPYTAGALAGLLAVLSVLLTETLIESPKYLGASTTFVRIAGLTEKAFVPDHVARNEYFQKTNVKIDWQMVFVLGIFLGALGSSLMGKSYQLEKVPPIWQERFGRSSWLRAAGGFLGGVIALFGVRLAGGCPSGHGLSGMMQLSLSGLIAMTGFLIGGILTANSLYRKREI